MRGDVKVGEEVEDRGVLKMAARKTTAQRNKEVPEPPCLHTLFCGLAFDGAPMPS